MDWGNLFVLEKVPWSETLGVQRALFAGFLLVFLAGAGAWPVALLRARFHPRPAPGPRPAAVAWLLLEGTGLLNAVFLLGLAVLLPHALDLGLQFGMPPALAALFVLPQRKPPSRWTAPASRAPPSPRIRRISTGAWRT